jgi:hypothetical protein
MQSGVGPFNPFLFPQEQETDPLSPPPPRARARSVFERVFEPPESKTWTAKTPAEKQAQIEALAQWSAAQRAKNNGAGGLYTPTADESASIGGNRHLRSSSLYVAPNDDYVQRRMEAYAASDQSNRSKNGGQGGMYGHSPEHFTFRGVKPPGILSAKTYYGSSYGARPSSLAVSGSGNRVPTPPPGDITPRLPTHVSRSATPRPSINALLPPLAGMNTGRVTGLGSGLQAPRSRTLSGSLMPLSGAFSGIPPLPPVETLFPFPTPRPRVSASEAQPLILTPQVTPLFATRSSPSAAPALVQQHIDEMSRQVLEAMSIDRARDTAARYAKQLVQLGQLRSVDIAPYVEQNFMRHVQARPAGIGLALKRGANRYIRQCELAARLAVSDNQREASRAMRSGEKLLCAAALMVTHKRTDDFSFLTQDYASIFGVDAAQLADCERRLLNGIQFSLGTALLRNSTPTNT